jgi:hypothetical protein
MFESSASTSPAREPTLSCDLLTTLGHKRYLLGSYCASDLEHLGDAGHLEVEIRANGFFQPFDIVVLNVAAILAQVSGDAVSPRRFAGERCFYRIRLTAATRLPQRGDVINIDV